MKINSDIDNLSQKTEMLEKDKKPRVGIVNFERRRHPRFSVDLPIEYYRIDSTTHHTGSALDASEDGLLIYLSEQMEIGQYLRLKLFFASGPDMSILEMMVQVVWMDIHMGKDWGDYRTGVKFIDISSEDRDRLKQFLRSLTK